MSNQTSRNSNSRYFINDNRNHIPGSLTRWDDGENLDNSLATIDDLGNFICPCVEATDILTDKITTISGGNLDLITNHLKVSNGPNENLVINNWSSNTATNLIVADITGNSTNSDYQINSSFENQTAQIFLNWPQLAGTQFYNRIKDPLSGNSNDFTLSLFSETSQIPTETFRIRLGDKISGVIGGGAQAVNVDPVGTEVMSIGLTDTLINNNLIIPSGQITASPINPLDIVNKSYADNIGGNPFDQTLNTTSAVNFASIRLPSDGETPSTLTFYKHQTISLGINGGTGWFNTITMDIVRVGLAVTITLTTENDSQTDSSILTMDPLPSWTHGRRIQGVLVVVNGGITEMGQYQIDPVGVLTIGAIGDVLTGPSPLNTGNCGFGGFTVSYSV